MSKSTSRQLGLINHKLSLENAILSKKIELTEKTLNNSLSSLAAGLRGDFGGGMSPLTSTAPMLQNNQYAPITLMWTAIMYMYKTHGLIQTAIDMPVLDALRGGIEVQSDQLSEDEISEVLEYLEENSVLDRIADAFIWARLFGGGALVINSEADPESELGDEVESGEIELYDACRWELTCERRIPASGFYGFYNKKLHKSRVLTILGKRAPWIIRAQLSDWGMSEIERMIEDFNLFLRNRNVMYELLEEAKVDVYSLKGFTGQLASSTGTELTRRRIQTMNQIKNFNNALIMDKDDTYEQKQISFAGIADMMKENRMGIAAALRMPMSKIFGIPAAGLNSGEDDIENYNGLIESEVRQPMKHVIRKVLKLVVRHLFGDDLDVQFNFKPLRVLNATDEETIKTSKSNRYVVLFDKMLMNSKELGEVLQKENLVPIPLQAEKGLLDDHPLPPTMAALGAAPGEGEEEGAGDAEADEGVKKVPEPKVGQETKKLSKESLKPKKPKENAAEKCFACGKPLGKEPALVDTRDGQTAYVGRECYKLIASAGEAGYQPPKGGPKLYLLKESN